MSNPVPVVRTISDLRAIVRAWKNDGYSVGLVPTMGALHHGHLSLINAIAEKADKVIVTIFVNPTQFSADEDLSKYPRQELEDRKKLADTKADIVFAPSVDEMYPSNAETIVSVPKLGKNFEGEHRPGHFDGVATIVAKLLIQSMCDIAIFGEKDYQQLAVIRRLTQDLNIPCEIMAGKLIREDDGLAASSRNAYLNSQERAIAGRFNKIVQELVNNAECNNDLRLLEATAIQKLLQAGFTEVDYVSIVDANTLEIISEIKSDARILAVARLGNIRLLDNMAIRPPKA